MFLRYLAKNKNKINRIYINTFNTMVKRNYTDKPKADRNDVKEPAVQQQAITPSEAIEAKPKKKGRRPSKAKQQYLKEQKELAQVTKVEAVNDSTKHDNCQCAKKEVPTKSIDEIKKLIDETPVEKIEEFVNQITNKVIVIQAEPTLCNRIRNWFRKIF